MLYKMDYFCPYASWLQLRKIKIRGSSHFFDSLLLYNISREVDCAWWLEKMAYFAKKKALWYAQTREKKMELRESKREYKKIEDLNFGIFARFPLLLEYQK